MKIHILGIGGTFMSAMAILARTMGHTVTGCDLNCYPPVSDLLKDKGITWANGYDVTEDALAADVVLIGNTVKRGLPVVEAVLNAGIPYISGPQWLAENVLSQYKVLSVSGTHGKTTTAAMVATILEYAGQDPGFFIGGVPSQFGTNTKLGKGEWFVIEADEYDSAFFDKRPKFIHFTPRIAILNNLEFDHADIFPNLSAIQQQFHYLLKTIPSEGLVLLPDNDEALQGVLAMGQYSQVEYFSLDAGGATWRANLLEKSGSRFEILKDEKVVAEVSWSLIGDFNVENALVAFAAAYHTGVEPDCAARALEQFKPVKRRLELTFNDYGVSVYDDFAHHPTAIAKTIKALQDTGNHARIFVALEFASYTMRSGYHVNAMGEALKAVDGAYLLSPSDFSLSDVSPTWEFTHAVLASPEDMATAMVNDVQSGDAIIVMSNRAFGDLHNHLKKQLTAKFA